MLVATEAEQNYLEPKKTRVRWVLICSSMGHLPVVKVRLKSLQEVPALSHCLIPIA